MEGASGSCRCACAWPGVGRCGCCWCRRGGSGRWVWGGGGGWIQGDAAKGVRTTEVAAGVPLVRAA
jgi:hypothetical protein